MVPQVTKVIQPLKKGVDIQVIERSSFVDKPSKVYVRELPTGEFDVWLRKNIELTEYGYIADEAYMRTDSIVDDIESDFDRFYDIAASWIPDCNVSIKERLSRLEKENQELKCQLKATIEAVDNILSKMD